MEERKDYTNKIITVPNVLSMFRILLIAPIIWAYTVKQSLPLTIAFFILSGATDILDGYIARKYKMISNVGKVLDPVADKLTQFAVVVCLVREFPALLVLAVIMVIKEITMGVTGAIVIKKCKKVMGASIHGKITTVFIYVTAALHILWRDIPQTFSVVMIVLCGTVMCMSLTLYLSRNINLIKAIPHNYCRAVTSADFSSDCTNSTKTG